MNGLIVSGVLTLGLLLAIAYQEWRIDGLNQDLVDAAVKYEKDVDVYRDADKKNQQTIEACRVAGEERISNAARRKNEAETAIVDAGKRSGTLEKNLEAINVHSKKIRLVDGGCPVVNDPAFIDFLCSGPLGCRGSG